MAVLYQLKSGPFLDSRLMKCWIFFPVLRHLPTPGPDTVSNLWIGNWQSFANSQCCILAPFPISWSLWVRESGGESSSTLQNRAGFQQLDPSVWIHQEMRYLFCYFEKHSQAARKRRGKEDQPLGRGKSQNINGFSFDLWNSNLWSWQVILTVSLSVASPLFLSLIKPIKFITKK